LLGELGQSPKIIETPAALFRNDLRRRQRLRDILAEKALPGAEVISAAKKAGVSERTLNRAKPRAGVRSFRQTGLGGKGHWMWWVPDPSKTNNPASADQDCQGCQESQPSNLGDVGNLADQVGQEGQGCQPQNLGNLGNLAAPEGESDGDGRDDDDPIVEVEI
jgi:hypothetical protein